MNVRIRLEVTETQKKSGNLTSTLMKFMLGVKLRVTLVLYALSFLFLTVMSTSILSLLDLMSILKQKTTRVQTFTGVSQRLA